MEGQRIDSEAAFSAGRSPHIDIPDGVKLAAASGFAQIRDGFGRMSTNVDAIMDAMEKSYFVAVKDTAGLHSKILETCQTNVSAILDFTGELAAARSPSDMVGLSTGFARRVRGIRCAMEGFLGVHSEDDGQHRETSRFRIVAGHRSGGLLLRRTSSANSGEWSCGELRE